jgi:hypothetical protein
MDVLAEKLNNLRIAFRRTYRPHWLRWDVVGVVIVGMVVAGQLGLKYWPQARQLWTDVVHDRNAHLEVGLGLASDIAYGRPLEVIRDIDKIKTWPPLHDGGLVTLTLLLTKLDWRFAVLPSLLGFVMTVVFSYLLARRLVDDQVGMVAGITAAVLALVSPAQRAFATDVMMESLGAGMTMAALYAAVRVQQSGSWAEWRWLAIALSGLFFLKYNYWLLVVMALAGSWALKTGWPLNSARARWRELGPMMARQLRHPLNWLIAILIAVGVTIKLTGGVEFMLFGHTIAARSPVGVATAAYWLILLRLAPWVVEQWRNGHADSRWLTMLNWHLIPAALWLAWPQKLASFLWFLNPGDNVGEFPAANRWQGFPFLANTLAVDYHFALWSFVLVACLMWCGMLAWAGRQFRTGAAVVVFLALISIWLTASHPNRKSRFAHSWVPTMWVLAGAGMATLVRRTQLRWQSAATIASLSIIAVHLPGAVAAPHAPEGGVQRHRPSALAITDAYLPYLHQAERPAILSNVPIKFLARWTYMDRYGRGVRPVTDVPNFNSDRACDNNQTVFEQWLMSSKCDALVFVDFPPDSVWYVPVPRSTGLEQFRMLCAQQKQMKLVARIDSVPGAIISVFTK